MAMPSASKTPLKAIAYKPGMYDSAVTSVIYYMYKSPYDISPVFTQGLTNLTSDFEARLQLPPSDTSETDWYNPQASYYINYPGETTWGPLLAKKYPAENGAPHSLEWQQQRLIASAKYFINTQYQHHHILQWDPPQSWPIDSTVLLGHQSKGIDCSNFISWNYAFALGYSLSSEVADQANLKSVTGPDGTEVAVSEVAKPEEVKTLAYKDIVSRLHMGDLVYLNPKGKGATHVFMWIGQVNSTGDYLIIDSHDMYNATDVNGNKIPTGVQIRPFKEKNPDGSVNWYFKHIWKVNRILSAAKSVDLRKYLGWNASNMSQRSQGHCGDCFVWAGTALVEVAVNRTLNLNPTERLSIEFYNSCFADAGCYPPGKGDCVCISGNPDKDLTDFASFYTYKGFAVPWSNTNAAFADTGGTCTIAAASITTTPRYTFSGPVTVSTVKTTGVSTDEAIANIKALLQQGEAVYFGKHTPYSKADDFQEFWDEKDETTLWDESDGTKGSEPKGVDAACGAIRNSTGGAHGIVVIGYDATEADPAKHYWLVMNSWGTRANRPNGVFRMPMKMNYECKDDKNRQLRFFYGLDVPVSIP
ncbi:MAG: hypothetical protein CSYNP_00230 [Syntrophus sp. SKADARSKE-3]|nr:hypothetical protein [Syntrophus sp. SKADARSKE-3]